MQAPKLLHAADLHVGDSRGLPGYLERQRAMLYGLVEMAGAQKVDVLILAGDIFDSRYVMNRERDMFCEWLIAADAHARYKFTIVMISGNHDVIDAGYTHLYSYRVMQDKGLLRQTHVVDAEPRYIELAHQDQTLGVGAFPYQGYKKDQLVVAAQAMHAEHQPDWFVVTAHEAVLGAENEAGTYRVGRGPQVGGGPVTYWAMGDIHKPAQRVGERAWYPGSPIQHDFGDRARERGALLVDLDRPDQPELLQLGGVTPLVTLYDVPDAWPEDAIVRYEGTAREIAEQRFPDNVVAFKPVVAQAGQQVSIDNTTHGVLRDCTEVMDKLGVPDDIREDVVTVMTSALGG